MSIRYTELFRVECLHGYFADHGCRVLTLTPTVECQRLLDRYDCLFRAISGGGAVYSGEQNATSRLRLLDEETPFAFAVNSTDPQLGSYTQTTAPAESLFYFNNVQEHAATIAGVDRMLLHPPGDTFAGAALPVRPAQFTWTFPSPVSAAKLQVIDALGRVVWKGETAAAETSAFTLNLSGLTTGRYQLQVNGQGDYHFYIGNVTPARQWGVVEIFPGGSAIGKFLPQSCKVIDDNGAPLQPLRFTIAMEPRSSFWRYYIVSQSTADRTYDGYRIEGALRKAGGKPIAFSEPAPQKLNGKDCWVFESRAAIPLFEVPAAEHEFTLKATGRTSGPRSVVLPYAGSGSTRLENGPLGELRMCSEIFVNL